jgi:phosphotriesterase-related protein
MLQAYPERVPIDLIIPEAVAALRQFREAGGSTIVDCSTHDLGRNVQAIAHIARESEMNIIVATGSWLDPPRAFHAMNPEDLAELWIREASVGIEGTGIKAGVLKCAHESGVTWEQGEGFTQVGNMLCRAVARAQIATGLPVITHTEVEEHLGMAQIRVFKQEGVDLNRVYIGHCDDSEDLSYLTEMLHEGVWIGLDRAAPFLDPDSLQPDWEGRAKTIKRLIDVGWGHRILLSHGWMVFNGFASGDSVQNWRSWNPDGYTFILQKVVPLLHTMGVSKDQTDAILFSNPRRFFENSK